MKTTNEALSSKEPAPRWPAGLMQITQRPEAVMVRGEGSWLWDDRGRRFLDFVQGWAVNSLGHAPSVIREALAEQSGKLLSPSPAFHNAPQIALANALVSKPSPPRSAAAMVAAKSGSSSSQRNTRELVSRATVCGTSRFGPSPKSSS